MRAFLINDTRCNGHVGCDLVIAAIMQQCRRVGIELVGTVLNSSTSDAAEIAARVDDFDLLLVNGEGTLHHDQPKALRIAEAVRIARQAGRQCVLLNTVWQDNDEACRMLECFDQIYCRESISAAQLQRDGATARVVPDLVFSHSLASDGEKRGVAVLDSFDRRTTLRLAWRSAARGYAFLPMHIEHYRKLKKRTPLGWTFRLRGGRCIPPGQQWLSELTRSELVLSPRFHGTCLALLAGRATAIVASNTQKVEGLVADIGLPEDVVFPLSDACRLLDRRRLERAVATVVDNRAKIDQYLRRARTEIEAMFDSIGELALAAAS